MYAGPRGLKRPAKERLGPNVFIRSAAVPVSEPQGYLKRQRQDSVKWNNDLHGGKTPVVKYQVPKDVKYEVSKDLKSPIQKDVIRSSKNIIDSARGFNKKALKIGQTPTNACAAELKVAPSIELVPTKKSAVQSKPAPSLGEKKHIVAEHPTVAAFLQRIGLSKYLINFQAEEVKMKSATSSVPIYWTFLGLHSSPKPSCICGRKEYIFLFFHFLHGSVMHIGYSCMYAG